MSKKKSEELVLPLLQVKGKDEMNLAEFPFCQLSDKTSKTKVLHFSYDSIQEDGTIIHREWRVEGGAECGLPRPTDEDVYVGLMLLTTHQGFDSPKVTFTIYELLDVLGWDKSGKSYLRIRASLRRLRNLSIEAINAFKDNKTKRYEKFLGFGIIDDYEVNTNIGAYPALRFDDSEVSGDKSYIRWNTRLFKSFKDGYIKNLDQEFYRSLKSTISKRIYRFLDKKFYLSSEIVIDVMQLGYEHIGLSRQSSYPSKVWEKLIGGIKELQARNYLALAERNGRNARFVRAIGPIVYEEKTSSENSADASTRLAEVSYRFLQEATKEGINNRQANHFLKKRTIAEIERACELICYFRTVIFPKIRDRIANPPGYLLTLLRDESFEIPPNFSAYNESQLQQNDDDQPQVEKLQREIADYLHLDEVAEETFSKLAPLEKEMMIAEYIEKMLDSKHQTIYRSWPKELLREQAIYFIKKDLLNKGL